MPIPARNAGQYAPPEKAGQSHKSCNCAATLVVAEPFWEPACAEADINNSTSLIIEHRGKHGGRVEIWIAEKVD